MKTSVMHAEASQILFDTQDNRNRDKLVTLTDTRDDEADGEENGHPQDFQNGYSSRKKRRKPRNSYSPTIQPQNIIQGKRQRSSISQVTTSQHRR